MNTDTGTHKVSTGRRVRNIALWVAAGAVVVAGAIIFLASLNKSSGDPVLENPGTLIGTLIVTVGGMFSLILGVVLKAQSDTTTIKDHVQNAHVNADGTPLILRDDLDQKHDRMESRMDGIETLMREGFSDLKDQVGHAIQLAMGTSVDMRGVRMDVSHVNTQVAENSRRLSTVERRQDDGLRRLDSLEGLEDTEEQKE